MEISKDIVARVRTTYQPEVTVYPEGGRLNNPLGAQSTMTTPYDIDFMIGRGTATPGVGELYNIKYPVTATTSSGDVFKYNANIQGSTSDVRSIPIKNYGVGRITKTPSGFTSEFSTESVLGKTTSDYRSSFMQATGKVNQPGEKAFAILKGTKGETMAVSEVFYPEGFSPLPYSVPTSKTSFIKIKGSQTPIYPQGVRGFDVPKGESIIGSGTSGGMAEAQIVRQSSILQFPAGVYDVPVQSTVSRTITGVPMMSLGGNTLSVLSQPQILKQPSISSQPQTFKQPTLFKQPEITKQPSMLLQPELSRQPQIFNQPTNFKQPNILKQPEITTQPQTMRQAQILKQPEITRQPELTKIIQQTPTFNVPPIRLLPPPPTKGWGVLPPFKDQSGGVPFFGESRRFKKQKFKYTPDIISNISGITRRLPKGVLSSSTALTGLEIRPISKIGGGKVRVPKATRTGKMKLGGSLKMPKGTKGFKFPKMKGFKKIKFGG
jgi:hypothetical protein